MKYDVISRQAAIDHFKSITVATSIGNKYNEGFVDGLNFAVGHLKTMPSIQPDVLDTNVGDLISRQGAIDAVDKLSDKPIDYLESAIDVLVDLPSVQPDIIACGDCKHYIPHDKRCRYWNHGVQPLMWCSQAERRTDEPN